MPNSTIEVCKQCSRQEEEELNDVVHAALMEGLKTQDVSAQRARTASVCRTSWERRVVGLGRR